VKALIKHLVGSFIFLIFSTHITMADTDYNQAKKLRDAGEILPLEKILNKLSTKYPGRILEVELEIEDALPLYEIDIIDSKGQVWELIVDARTGEVIQRKLDD
jgi:uncharacterized membrane protein YkoI